MTLYLGNNPIAGISQNKICNAHFLFEPIWSDHIINDISLLRADTFSWQSGDVYTSAYNHLVQDIQGATTEYDNFGAWFGWYGISGTSSAGWIIWTKTPEPKVGDIGYYNTPHTATCTITAVTDTTITISNSELGTGTLNKDSSRDENPSQILIYRRATDGHKICLADQEQTVLNIYNTYGIAWYYIVDTVNTQFKLPRTKYGFEGLRTNVGDKIDESLPNIKGTAAGNSTATEWNYNDNMEAYFNGALYVVSKQNSGIVNTGSGATKYALGFNASHSSSTYQDNAPVQERATQMYLYFYVGDYAQTAIEQTAGLNSELFNSKVDLPVGRNQSSVGLVTESYVNGASWYRVYSDGWCEQGGNASQSVTLLKPYINTNYIITLGKMQNDNTTDNAVLQVYTKSTTGFTLYRGWGNGSGVPRTQDMWRACGYIS